MKAIVIALSLFAGACSTLPRFDAERVRSWNKSLDSEYPNEKAVIAYYKRNDFELYYLAARHTKRMGEDTLSLVQTLFDKHHFNVLIIESIPYSSGKSPQWFIDEAKSGQSGDFIKGGEGALAVILADKKKIPFFAGEPDHQQIYKALKSKNYSDLDIVGFYAVRQVPQWVREKESKEDLLQRKIPPFAKQYCKLFSISRCPTFDEIMAWYKEKLGNELVADVSNEEVAPFSDGRVYTQKIASDIGNIRDHFTLKIIEQLVATYKKVAVVYGAGHFITLRKSFDASFGLPSFIEDHK